MIIRVLLILVIGAGWHRLFGQVLGLNLDSCVQFAITNREEIQMDENTLRNVKQNINYTRQEYLPSVNTSYSHYYNIGRSLNMEEYVWENSQNQYGNLSVNLGVNLFSGFSLLNKVRESKFLYARNQTLHEKLKNDIKLEITQYYYQVIAAIANVELNDKFYKINKEREERLRILEQQGRISKLELLQAEAESVKSLNNVLLAKKQRQTLFMHLKQSMNFPKDVDFNVVAQDVNESAYVPSSEIVYQSALASLPDITLQRQDSSILQLRMRQTKAVFYPSVSLNGGIYSRYQKDLQNPTTEGKYTLFDQINNNNYKQLGITLSIPIYNQSKARKQVKTLQTEFLNMTLEQQQKRRNLYYEINELCLEAGSRQESCELLRLQVNKYYQIYEMRKIQYEKGELLLYDLLEIENTFKTTEITLSVEYANLHYYLKMIAFYMGIF